MDEPYQLLDEDVEYLDTHHAGDWRKVAEGVGKFGLIVDAFRVPAGYHEGETTLLLLVPSGYPGAPIDMFYLRPPLHKRKGGTIPALADEAHFGTVWQRWSRHYEWKPGEDNVAKHIQYVGHELAKEAAR